MIRFKKFFFIFIGVLVFQLHFSLTFSQSVNQPYYKFRSITTKDGLCTNDVHCVYKDTRGFLWIGTQNGLQRYNGSTFDNFRHNRADTSSIANEAICSIAEDSKRDIWISTRNGISKFDYNNGKIFNFLYGLRGGKQVELGLVLCFFEDSRGRKWIGTVNAGLFLFDSKKGMFVNFEPQPYLGIGNKFEYVGQIQESGTNEIIFVVKDGFVIINKDRSQQYEKVPPPTDKKIVYLPCAGLPLLKEHPEEIWIRSLYNGFFKFDRLKKKWSQMLPNTLKYDQYIGSVMPLNNEEWVCCGIGPIVFNHRNGKVRQAFPDEKMEPVSQIFNDNENNLWIATSGKGLLFLNNFSKLFSSAHFIKDWKFDRLLDYDSVYNTLYSINAYNIGDILSYNFISGSVGRNRIPGAVKFHHVINDFLADNNNLFFARWGGMCRYDLASKSLSPIIYKSGSFNSETDNFFDVCKSKEKIYFAGGGSGSPYMFDKRTQQVVALSLLSEKYAVHNYCGFSLCFNKGVLYSGFNYGDSIYCYNENTGDKYSIAIPVKYLFGIPDGIQTLCVDKNENLWCGTPTNGIYIYHIPSKKWIKHINQQDDNFFGSAAQLLCDDDGNVWCNGSEGLFVFNNMNFSYKRFTKSDGLFSDNAGGMMVSLNNHRLAFNNIENTDASFGIINTIIIKNPIKYIPITISNLKVMGNSFLSDTLLDNVTEIKLPPGQNAFSINYAGLDITEGKQLSYSYLLERAETKWHEAGNEQNLSYVNLEPGKYILHIKCKNSNNSIVGKERLLKIIMLPHWYQTWWFSIIFILMLAGLFFMMIRYYYQEKIKKQQVVIKNERALTEERNRIAADMHDDVGAGLSRIRYITAAMKGKTSLNEEDIDKIVSLSDESVEKMNEIIWALNQGNQQLDELIYYTRSQCSEMVNNANLHFNFKIPEEIPSVVLPWKDCRNIFLLVKEAVNNAIKHASARTITVQFETNGELLIRIQDDGIGFNQQDSHRHGNGLVNYSKRIESLQGKYNIKSSALGGAIILFSIPIRT